MATIYILKGLPGCGKTTLAKKLLKSEKKILRINKDDLRSMAQFGGYQSTSERAIVQAEYDIVDLWLSKGFSVIVDDTNLNPIHSNKYEEIAKKYPWANIKYHDLLSVPIEQCIAQDLQRKGTSRYVGKDNIINMGFRFGVMHQTRSCVIFDLDGTLSDPSHRRHFVRQAQGDEINPEWKPNWVQFFETCDQDTPREEVIQKARDYHAQGIEVIICSARPEDYREKSEEWLRRHNVPFDRFIMRRFQDYRKDTVVKKEYLDQFLDKTKILRVFDDRPCVIRMWRDNGLDVEDVGDGQDF